MWTFKEFLKESNNVPFRSWINVHSGKIHGWNHEDTEHHHYVKENPHIFGLKHEDLNKNPEDINKLAMSKGFARTYGGNIQAHDTKQLRKAVNHFTSQHPVDHVTAEMENDDNNYKFAELHGHEEIHRFVKHGVTPKIQTM